MRIKITITSIIFLIIAITPVNADVTDQICNTHQIQDDEPGYGATQVCDIFYKCGEKDGVCPMDYAVGDNETTNVTMRVYDAGADNAGYTFEPYFTTGDDACDSVAGTCTQIYSSSDGETWSTSGVNCGDDVSSNNQYFKAKCTDVPVTAGCENCPDPDCETQTTAIAYDTATNNTMKDVNVILEPYHYEDYYQEEGISILQEGTTASDGTVTFSTAPRGNLDYTCYKQDYQTIRNENYSFQHNNNTIICPMECAVTLNESEIGDLGYSDDDLETSNLENHSECVVQSPEEPDTAICSQNCKGDDCQLTIPSKCQGREIGTEFFEGINSDGNREYTECCSGEIIERESMILEINGENVTNLFTRNYRRQLNGRSVNLKIITYEKEQ